jgi:DHA2 family multidrug resistance protein
MIAEASTERNRGLVTVCVMLATIMQALDTTIANVALPYMQGSLSATLDQVNWVLTSYIVASAIMTPPTGWLADRFGRKRLFIASVIGFTVASVLCGLAQSIEQMVLFRLLQGVFGASLVPLSQAVLFDIYPRERHGSAMALWGVGVMVGPILGPTLGGYLTDAFDWRWVFYINVPVGILTVIGLSSLLRETPLKPATGFDWFGFTTLSLAIGGLQMALDRGEQLDWFSSGEIVIESGICLTALAMFLVHFVTAERPFISPELFKDRNFNAGLVFIFILGLLLLATMALITPFLQNLMGYPVVTAGLVLSPRGLGTMAAMMVVGRLISRVDPRWLITAGLLFTAWSLWMMSRFTSEVSISVLVWSGVIQGVGLGFIFVPLSTIAFATLPAPLRTQGTALFSLVRNAGSSIGISIVIFLLTRTTQVAHAGLAEGFTAFNANLHRPDGRLWDPATHAGRLMADAEISRQATTIAYIDDFWLMMLVSFAALPLVVILRRPAAKPKAPAAVMD